MRSGSFSLRVLITARCGFTVGVAFTPCFVGLGANRFSAIYVDGADFFTSERLYHWVEGPLRGASRARAVQAVACLMNRGLRSFHSLTPVCKLSPFQGFSVMMNDE